MNGEAARKAETAAEALRRGEEFLRERGAERPRTSGELLLAHVLKVDRSGMFLDLRRSLRPEESEAYSALLGLRAEGRPLAHLVGTVGFHELELVVGPGVFIPRPETEALVEAVRGWFAPSSAPRLLDLCCGAGAIALALKRALPAATVFASDISPEALIFARRNAAAESGGRVEFREGDLFAPWGEEFRGSFDVVAGNPPYIRSGEIKDLAPEVSRYEPSLALDGGEDGLAVIRRLVRESAGFLVPGGRLIFEIGADQGEAASALCRARGGWEDISVLQDLAGRDRAVAARKEASSKQ